MQLNELIRIIQDKEKLKDPQIIGFLSDAVASGEEESAIFKKLYVEAFGFNIIQEIADAIIQENGEQFALSVTEEFREKCGCNRMEIKPAEFYLIMNDICIRHKSTILKHKITDPLIYAELAADWFRDAEPEEIFNFYFK